MPNIIDYDGIKLDFTIKVWPTIISLFSIIIFIVIFYTTTIADHTYIENTVKPYIEKAPVENANKNGDMNLILYRLNQLSEDVNEIKKSIKK